MFKGEITISNSARLQKSIVSMYDLELAEIKSPDTREVLANIMYNRDMTEVNAIKIAFYLSKLNDEHAHNEGFRNATEMIMNVTGLKKSMISNYIKVARAFFWDDNREFFVPDCLQGFTITQLTEGLEKVGSAAFMEDIMSGEITPDMSAKSIRAYYKERENTVDTTATESTATEPTATESTVKEPTATGNNEPIKATSNDEIFHLCLVNMDGTPIALVTPINNYTSEDVLALFPDKLNLKEVEG